MENDEEDYVSPHDLVTLWWQFLVFDHWSGQVSLIGKEFVILCRHNQITVMFGCHTAKTTKTELLIMITIIYNNKHLLSDKTFHSV